MFVTVVANQTRWTVRESLQLLLNFRQIYKLIRSRWFSIGDWNTHIRKNSNQKQKTFEGSLLSTQSNSSACNFYHWTL
jgi:hypothetical protein